MKIQVKTEVVKDLEIKLPVYVKSKSGIHFYKVYSEDYCLAVGDMSWGYSLSINKPSLAFHGEYDFISKEEFDQIYEKVSNVLNAIKN